MKFVISADGDQVAAHFGRCEYYQVAEVENGQVIDSYRLENPGHEPGRLPTLCKEEGAGCIVAGGMGPRAQDLFTQMGISTTVGVSGSLDQVISQIAAGTLQGGNDQCIHT